ncbi:THAP domain-containing protein 1-like [Pseudomyrmex gracilis]|uniref:THAP domain-containing protein 1-like n=1 Tax=Pseudomyrmex gracilis TaxID=219809 RepID=UPI0009955EB8|nr:THAP domain-containing protein 1-like [Pseudomyrmex gracilis]
MVQTCCVTNCKERQKRDRTISFHQFPKNPELQQQWRKAIKCGNFNPSSHARVCSKHFSSDCFVESPWSSKRILKSNAIPNVPHILETRHMQEKDILNVPCIETKNKTANLKNKCEDESLIHTVSANEENVSLEKPLRKKRKVYVGDFEECDVITEKKNYVEIINTTIAKKNKQIKILQQKNRRLIKKIKDLHSVFGRYTRKRRITSRN